MLTGLAHTALCVPDVEAATRWYADVLGFEVLSPPYLMEGPAIEADMGELIPSPVRLKAAIIGLTGDGDRAVELIEYPGAPGRPRADEVALTDHGFTHIGVVCDDLEATRADLEAKGVRFLTAGTATVAGLRTTWLADPWGNVIILLEKSQPEKPYFAQY